MSMKNEIKACLIASLESTLDPYLAERGFTRRAKSLVYKRKYQGAIQTIDNLVQVHPKDNPNAAAAVYPIMEVHVPVVDRVMDDMIAGNRSLMEGCSKGLSNQPIDFTSQKAELGRWFVYQADSVPEIVQCIRSFIERWTMPFLDVYTTAEGIVAAHERQDGRMVVDRAHVMRVVAAALVCNRRDYALAQMEKWLGRPVTRRRYQQVYDYIQESPQNSKQFQERDSSSLSPGNPSKRSAAIPSANRVPVG